MTETRVGVATDPDPRPGNVVDRWDITITEVSSEPSVNETRATCEKAIKNQRVVWP